MKDAMLGELYRRAFVEKERAEMPGQCDNADRRREVALAKNKLLTELIDIRTDQIRDGRAQ